MFLLALRLSAFLCASTNTGEGRGLSVRYRSLALRFSVRQLFPTDAARVSAANALLDRAYGKPAVKQEQEIVDLPPMVIQLTGPSEPR